MQVGRELGVDAGSIADRVKRAGGGQVVPDPAGNPFRMAEDLKRLQRENARLKRGGRDSFKSQRLLREQAAVKKAKFSFIDRMRGDYPVAETCRALGVSRQGYYARVLGLM